MGRRKKKMMLSLMKTTVAVMLLLPSVTGMGGLHRFPYRKRAAKRNAPPRQPSSWNRFCGWFRKKKSAPIAPRPQEPGEERMRWLGWVKYNELKKAITGTKPSDDQNEGLQKLQKIKDDAARNGAFQLPPKPLRLTKQAAEELGTLRKSVAVLTTKNKTLAADNLALRELDKDMEKNIERLEKSYKVKKQALKAKVGKLEGNNRSLSGQVKTLTQQVQRIQKDLKEFEGAVHTKTQFKVGDDNFTLPKYFGGTEVGKVVKVDERNRIYHVSYEKPSRWGKGT